MVLYWKQWCRFWLNFTDTEKWLLIKIEKYAHENKKKEQALSFSIHIKSYFLPGLQNAIFSYSHRSRDGAE